MNLAVDIFAVPYFEYFNRHFSTVEFVDDAIRSHPDAESIGKTGQFSAARGKWIKT